MEQEILKKDARLRPQAGYVETLGRTAADMANVRVRNFLSWKKVSARNLSNGGNAMHSSRLGSRRNLGQGKC